MKKILISMVILSLCGCITKEYKGGIPIRQRQYDQIKTAKTKNDIYEILGSPSATNFVGTEKWFYYTSEGTIFAFMDPKFTKYEILSITFDKNNNISNINLKDLKNKDLSYNKSETTNLPSEIKLSVFQELFGNIGKFKQNTPK